MVESEVLADLKLEDLFLQFLQRVGNSDPSLSIDGNHQQVVLEAELNGARYTLSRTIIQVSPPQASLSPREKEIVRLVAKGHVNKAIAAVLDVSPWTVATHLRRVFDKLRVCSRAEMIARVLEDGLLDGENKAR